MDTDASMEASDGRGTLLNQFYQTQVYKHTEYETKEFILSVKRVSQ